MKLTALLGIILLSLMPAIAPAHSTSELSEKLASKEKFFQPVDQPAPDFALFGLTGTPVSLTDYRGKVVVLYFIYGNCPDVCPLQSQFIADVQASVNLTPMRDMVEFVAITTDPLNDTDDFRRDYGLNQGLDMANWNFLTSGQDRLTGTRELVAKFGHKFELIEDGLQVHGTVTHVIDQRGQWRGNFHGLDFNKTNLVLFINALTNERHRDDEDESTGFWGRIIGIFN